MELRDTPQSANDMHRNVSSSLLLIGVDDMHWSVNNLDTPSIPMTHTINGVKMVDN